MAYGAELCPHCAGSARRLSRWTLRTGVRAARSLFSRVFDHLAVLLLLLLGLGLAYLLSPLLLFFPFLFIGARPPASRGGKTVARGRTRRRR